MDPAALAAKRYKKFKAEHRNNAIKNKVAATTLVAAKGTIKVCQKLGFFRRKHVERIKIE